MKIVNFAETPSLVSTYMSELRDVNIQKDMLRFRRNIERIGEIMAYEISKTLEYGDIDVTTPLGVARCKGRKDQVVLATILRAGLPFHQGFLDMFDSAENAFVSAYRKYYDNEEKFDVFIEYIASPVLTDKTILLVDPMLATGSSMELAFRALMTKGLPQTIHFACVVASQQAVDYIQQAVTPEFSERTTLWVAAIDSELNAHNYIVPGLGDAGDLSYGIKE
ncbi:MAG: uracil phosphoribosyltransferase [Muribaculaceae bacterium]|nr:uracil phosphoribosyltransferase [Muribaculaceae bacterium]